MSLSWEDTIYSFTFLTTNSKTEIFLDYVFKKIQELKGAELYEFFTNEVFLHQEDTPSAVNIRIYIHDNYSNSDEEIECLRLIIDKILYLMFKYINPPKMEEYYNEDRHKLVFKKIEEFSEYLRSEYINIVEINESRKYIDELKTELKKINEDTEKTIELFYEEVEEKKNAMTKTTDEFMEKTKSNIDQIKKDLYKEILAIVGIFTAISFGAFGGISLLNELFSNAGNIRLNDLIIIGCISGIFILTLVYIIIDYLSKLIGIKIENIDEGKNRFYNFRRNHTPLYFSYLFITIILIVTGVVRYIK